MNPALTIIDKQLVTFDLETYRTCFLFGAKVHGVESVQVFEISNRRNQVRELYAYLMYLKSIDAFMVGYNNLDFDAPILEDFINNPNTFTHHRAYEFAQKIFDAQKVSKFSPFSVQLNKRNIHQIDLMKIWHYDNDNKRTRLKDLEFAMRMDSVKDLPYSPHEPLTSDQIDHLIHYLSHDLKATEMFLEYSAERVKLRRDLITSKALYGDVMNWNDTKIGEKFFVSKLGLKGRVRGTDRLSVQFKDVILNKIEFRNPQYQEVLENFKTKMWVKGNKDHNENIPFTRTLGGLDVDFGSGGVHASVKNRVYRECDKFAIIDIDVSGMYPAVGIANEFYPEHLGLKFVDVYKQLSFDRKQHLKGTAMNAVLKLANNGAYGKSNSEFSPLFDIKYLFSITINGQLQNLQLFEMLGGIPGLEFIQNNTDGMTVKLPRQFIWMFDLLKEAWEKETQLKLEQVEYSAMFCADVNNYISVKKDGSVKRIGKYWYAESWADYDAGPGKWHTDVSMMIVPKIAEQCMLYGFDPEFLLKLPQDKFDFMLRQKVQGKQVCYIGDTVTQRTARYYVSKLGQPMKVIRPAPGPIGWYKRKPKTPDALYDQVIKENGGTGFVWDARIHTGKVPKPGKPDERGKYEDTVSAIVKGYKVRDCCEASDFNFGDVDYDFYLDEINKIIIKE